MIAANQACLARSIELLDSLTDAQYGTAGAGASSVGAQYRHLLEHYQCLLAGLTVGRVDYDARRRDPVIEGSRSRARQVTEEIIAALAQLAETSTDHWLQVQIRGNPDDGPTWSVSTLGRELQFLLSHTIHHHALIKLLLAARAIPVEADFGLAPSTLGYRRGVAR
jgi:uncharacterized damage-inducible protein DinB